jgi:hypothetical protein
VTALARYTVRAEALHVSTPAAVLAGLHEALVSCYPDTILTALFLLLGPARDDIAVVVVKAPAPSRGWSGGDGAGYRDAAVDERPVHRGRGRAAGPAGRGELVRLS